MARSDLSRRSRTAEAELARKLASLATIALLLGVSAWLRPAHAPEWLPSHKLIGLAIEPPRLRSPLATYGGQARSVPATTTVDGGLPAGAWLEARVRSTRQGGLETDAIPLVASAPMTPTDVPVALTLDAPRIAETVVSSVPLAPRDPVADAFVIARRRTGSAFRAGAVHTGGAFRTAGRAIKSIF
jgi:hypothetical protein